jgi:hypothetical protein
MKRAFIYIGAPGPGTERIQAMLQKQEGFLKTQGVLCPQAGRIHPSAAVHHQLVYELRGDLHFNPQAGGLDALDRELDINPVEKVILCSNMLITLGFRPASIHALRDVLSRRGYDTTWLVYLRSYTEWLTSSYIEQRWMGLTQQTFEEWRPAHHNPVMAAPDKLLRAFMETGDPFILRSYSQVEHRFAEDFLTQLEIPCPDDLIDVLPGRGILDFEMRRLVDAYAALHLDQDGLDRLKARVEQEAARIPRSPRLKSISSKDRAALEKETRASQEALLQMAGITASHDEFFGSLDDDGPQSIEELPAADLAELYKTFFLCATT